MMDKATVELRLIGNTASNISALLVNNRIATPVEARAFRTFIREGERYAAWVEAGCPEPEPDIVDGVDLSEADLPESPRSNFRYLLSMFGDPPGGIVIKTEDHPANFN